MHRVIVKIKKNQKFVLSSKQLKHLDVINRHKEFLCLFNNEFYRCFLEGKSLIPTEKLAINNEYKNPVFLALAIIKIKHLEWAIQKSVELGVTKIWLFSAKNSESKNVLTVQNKIKRFEAIIENAVEQSFRNKIPTIEFMPDLNSIIEANTAHHVYIAHEKTSIDKSVSRQILPTNSLLIVGPEGGFTDAEIELVEKSGGQVVSLGKRVLRSETAAVYLLSKISE